MTTVDRWQLPDGVEEVLPARAAAVERLRRRLLDLYRSWGYQLVIPPLMEFTESLLIGLGSDIDLLTFKMTDQISGRTLGVRADMTPQVARIDAHSLAQEGVSRLCYAGSTLHTQPKSLMASRSPIQLGAELYGDDSLAADVEVIELMLETLTVAGLDTLSLDLGHTGIYEAVLASAGLDPETAAEVFDALQRKSIPDLEIVLRDVDDSTANTIIALSSMHGGEQVLTSAKDFFAARAPKAVAAIDDLLKVAADIRRRLPALDIYSTSLNCVVITITRAIVFAAYVPRHGQALANGGRYNNVGEVFGRARPATGFATDLKALMGLLPEQALTEDAISVPADGAPELLAKSKALRASGEVVINSLSSEIAPSCNRQLVKEAGEWVVKSLESGK